MYSQSESDSSGELKKERNCIPGLDYGHMQSFFHKIYLLDLNNTLSRLAVYRQEEYARANWYMGA